MSVTVETAMVVIGCDRKKAIAIFKMLDQQNVARFVKGRKPWPTRLESN